MEVAPIRGLRYQLGPSAPPGPDAAAVTAPPYDVIRPEEHRSFLARSPYNITRLTLGTEPGGVSDYSERARMLREWIERGVLTVDPAPQFYLYTASYRIPGTEREATFRAFVGAGRLHAFDEGVVLPHEETFPKVIEDRLRLLEAVQAHLESILCLYSDPEGRVDAALSKAPAGEPLIAVEARAGETHALYPIADPDLVKEIREAMAPKSVVIADGHHRYTTALRFRERARAAGRRVPGADWQLMTFADLYRGGLSILATHRLVKLASGNAREALERLESALERVKEGPWDFRVESREGAVNLRVPDSIRAGRAGARATPYAILHDVVLGGILADLAGSPPAVTYFKEGTGEAEALARGEGDLLFRLPPVGRESFEAIVRGGEVLPHKTTFFYPKLWSGLVAWLLEEPPLP